jgi:hypothetical protein
MHINYDLCMNTDQLASSLFQRAASLPSDIALFFSCLPLIEQQVLFPRYQAFLEQHKSSLPELCPQDLAIAQELETNGISVTSLESLNLPNTASFFDAAQKLSEELALEAHSPKSKGKHTLTATAEQIMRHPEVFLWGAQERLLRIVERYLKLPAAYDGLSYYYSIANGAEAGPRKWHRDKEDWHMIKIGIYLNDVDFSGGPFECVLPNANEQICRHAQSRYQVYRHDELKDLLGEDPQSWQKSYSGSSGTVIFVDTASYYHRGRPPISASRSAIFFGYFSFRPKHPFFCGRSPLSQEQLTNLSQSLPPHIQDSILWRKKLAGIGRCIPKNYLKV